MAGTVTGWLDRLKSGDESVTEQLWSHYSPGLRSRITPRCKGLKICDEEDIVSESFFRLISSFRRDGYECTNRTDFWRLLIVIAKNAIGDKWKYESAIRRGGGKTIVSIDDNAADASTGWKPSPDDQQLLEKFANLATELERPEFMKIIELKQQGLSHGQIAMSLNYSLRTVQYIISDIKSAWKKCFADD